jgi:hypothetical protein
MIGRIAGLELENLQEVACDPLKMTPVSKDSAFEKKI